MINFLNAEYITIVQIKIASQVSRHLKGSFTKICYK